VVLLLSWRAPKPTSDPRRRLLDCSAALATTLPHQCINTVHPLMTTKGQARENLPLAEAHPEIMAGHVRRP
jgi:hypothetical protein